MLSFFSLLAFKFLSLFLTFVSLITTCLSVFFLEFILPGTVCLLYLVDYVLSHVRGVFSYYLFKYFLRSFLSSPSGTHIMQISVCLMLSQRCLRLSSFIFILFSIFCFTAVISTHSVFHVTYLFFCLSYSALDSFLSTVHFCSFF